MLFSLQRPDEAEDPLTAVLRSGAHRLLTHPIEAKAEALLATLAGMPLSDRRKHLLRHEHGPKRQMQTGTGPGVVRRVKLRHRGISEAAGRIRLTGSAAVPPSRYGWHPVW